MAAQSGRRARPGAGGGGGSGAMAADVFMRPAQLLGAAGPLSPRTEPDEDSSDTDDGGASPGGGRRCGPRRGQPPGPQIIHSGHFMVSSPHSEHPPKKGYDFDTVNEQTCQTYQFGAARGGGGAGGRLSIDASLTKLFECMSLAYRYRARGRAAPGLVSQRRGESPEGAGRGAGPGQRRGRAELCGAAWDCVTPVRPPFLSHEKLGLRAGAALRLGHGAEGKLRPSCAPWRAGTPVTSARGSRPGVGARPWAQRAASPPALV